MSIVTKGATGLQTSVTETSVMDTSEIKQIISTLEIEYKILEEEANLLDKQRREIGKEYIIKEAALTQIKNKLKEYEMFICHETMFDDDRIKSKNGFGLLTQNELMVIIKGIDKTDYNKYKRYRFSDVDRIVDNILQVKLPYPSWELKQLKKCGMIDSMSPYCYEMDFKTPEGLIFSRGGIKALK
jgi:hypothetical protein